MTSNRIQICIVTKALPHRIVWSWCSMIWQRRKFEVWATPDLDKWSNNSSLLIFPAFNCWTRDTTLELPLFVSSMSPAPLMWLESWTRTDVLFRKEIPSSQTKRNEWEFQVMEIGPCSSWPRTLKAELTTSQRHLDSEQRAERGEDVTQRLFRLGIWPGI